MNAPEKITEPLHMNIALTQLFPSPTQPRKRFDEAALNDLAASIKMQGVLQPILVRQATPPTKKDTWPFPTKGEPNNDPKFEIIAGERRYRAAKLAGLADIPCFIRQLTDVQVLHAQVIENLQRDDLHPIEEAEGYKKLMLQKNESGEAFTADRIAAEIGKSRAYIYARLKLLDLCPEAREAFFMGKLGSETALLIARIPVEKLQLQALKKITITIGYGNTFMATGDAMSYRAARDLIQNEFMTDLDRAPFQIKDATLLLKAGSCTDCIKRTGNQPELFDDVSSKDICTDTVCFAMKKAAHILAIQKKAEDEGCLVITGKKAKEIIKNPSWSSKLEPTPESGYVRLDSVCPHDPEKRTWEKVLGKKAFKHAEGTAAPDVQKIMVENTHTHELIPTVSIEQATKTLRAAGFEIKLANATRNTTNASNDKQEAKIKLEVEQTNAYRSRLFNTLRQQIEADMTGPKSYVAPGIYRILAEKFFDGLEVDYNECELLTRLYLPNLPAELEGDELFDEMKKHIPMMTTQQHFLLMVDTVMIGESEANRWIYTNPPKIMLAIATELGIDADAIEKEAVAEFKAAQKEAAKLASTPTAAAQAPKKGAPKTKAAQAPEVTA